MNELDRDTEAQIEKLVDDFRTKITRIVIKNSSKLLKEQSKNFKEQSKNSVVASSPRKVQNSSRPTTISVSKTRRRDYDTDDSD